MISSHAYLNIEYAIRKLGACVTRQDARAVTLAPLEDAAQLIDEALIDVADRLVQGDLLHAGSQDFGQPHPLTLAGPGSKLPTLTPHAA